MSAPNLKEIEWAISELEKEESDWKVYGKLADLYTVRKEMLGVSTPQPQIAAYSGPVLAEPPGQYGDSEFLHVVSGLDPGKAWGIMDELMETLQVVNKRAYDGVMRELERA